MHEIGIAQTILDTVKKSIATKKITAVNKIVVSLGVLSGIEKQSLLYSFGLIPKSQQFVNTKLVVKENVLVVYCEHCKIKTTITNSFVLVCSVCGARTNNIVAGKELTIDSIEY